MINNLLFCLMNYDCNFPTALLSPVFGMVCVRPSVRLSVCFVVKFQQKSEPYLSLLPKSTKLLILVIRHTLPSSYNIASRQRPRVHIPFCSPTQPFICRSRFPRRCVQNSLHIRQSQKSLLSDVILRRTTFSQPFLSSSGLAAPTNAL